MANWITMRMETDSDRQFWSVSDDDVDCTEDLPHIGDAWWDAEKELSPTLLPIIISS